MPADFSTTPTTWFPTGPRAPAFGECPADELRPHRPAARPAQSPRRHGSRRPDRALRRHRRRRTAEIRRFLHAAEHRSDRQRHHVAVASRASCTPLPNPGWATQASCSWARWRCVSTSCRTCVDRDGSLRWSRSPAARPSNLRPCQKFFRAPLRFDSDESSLVFESHWLGPPLPAVDALSGAGSRPRCRRDRAAILADFPTRSAHILRKQLVSATSRWIRRGALGMHRRTLDRRLKRHGMHYSEAARVGEARRGLPVVARHPDADAARSPNRCITRARRISPRHSAAGPVSRPSEYRRQAPLISRREELPPRPAGPRRAGKRPPRARAWQACDAPRASR